MTERSVFSHFISHLQVTMLAPDPDVWGALYRDHHLGNPAPHVFERDDGHTNEVESAALYFEAPRSDAERQALDHVSGPVLDLGAGPGSYALYLQDRGLHVTAADASPGAVDVARERGCHDAKVMDLRFVTLPPQTVGAVIVMGNTLGAYQMPGTLPVLLTTFQQALLPDGCIVAHTVDPLATDDPVHLAYHKRNRENGRPAGVVTLRLRYKGQVSDWHTLWMPTDEEFDVALSDAGLRVRAIYEHEHSRVRVLASRDASPS